MTVSRTIDEEEMRHRTKYRRRPDETLANAVIVALVEATGTSATEITPLYETVDPDALEELFGSRFSGSERPRGHVSFRHHDHCVKVEGDQVIVTPLAD